MSIICIYINWAALSAIATLFMTIVTFLTLRQNRKQMKELRRQWEEKHTPKIVPLVLRKSGYVILRFKNISNATAHDVVPHIKINATNKTLIWYFDIEEAINNKIRLLIEPDGYKDIIISQYWRETDYQGNISVEINYPNRKMEAFNLSLTELNIIEPYTDFDSISSQLNRIAEEIQSKKFM